MYNVCGDLYDRRGPVAVVLRSGLHHVMIAEVDNVDRCCDCYRGGEMMMTAWMMMMMMTMMMRRR